MRQVVDNEIDTLSIFDVVLPLPGHDVIYPPNMKEFYTQILARDGFDSNSFAHKSKEFSLSGSYRHVIALPINFSQYFSTCYYKDDFISDIVTYTNESEQLMLTDMDIIEGRTLADITVKLDGEASNLHHNADATKTALLVHFSLKASAYATMAIRELTHGGVLGKEANRSQSKNET